MVWVRDSGVLRQSPGLGPGAGRWEILTGLFAGGIVLAALPLAACKGIYCSQAGAMRLVTGTRVAGVCGRSAGVWDETRGCRKHVLRQPFSCQSPNLGIFGETKAHDRLSACLFMLIVIVPSLRLLASLRVSRRRCLFREAAAPLVHLPQIPQPSASATAAGQEIFRFRHHDHAIAGTRRLKCNLFSFVSSW